MLFDAAHLHALLLEQVDVVGLHEDVRELRLLLLGVVAPPSLGRKVVGVFSVVEGSFFLDSRCHRIVNCFLLHKRVVPVVKRKGLLSSRILVGSFGKVSELAIVLCRLHAVRIASTLLCLPTATATHHLCELSEQIVIVPLRLHHLLLKSDLLLA